MNLHNEIMNIQNLDIDEAVSKYGFEHRHLSYCHGHRDARHTAAELALKYDHLIEELLDALERRNADDFVDKIKLEYGL